MDPAVVLPGLQSPLCGHGVGFLFGLAAVGPYARSAALVTPTTSMKVNI
jgi:hypothetical protein